MAVTPTYVPLATITLTATDNEIVFSSIPATYRDLILVLDGKGTGSDVFGLIRLNGDTGSNYSWVQMGGASSGAFSGSTTTTSIRFAYIQNSSARVHGIAQIMDYAQTDKHKTALIRDSANGAEVRAIAARYASTTAVSSVTVLASGGNFDIGSTFSLYGIH